MTAVFISLGSNIDSEQNLSKAIQTLAARCRLLNVSPVYETAPVGNVDQPRFLNAAALIETELDAATLKTEVLLDIENTLGRVRTADKNAPRVIDLDISLYADQVLHAGSRHIPDPDIMQFAHVAVPLADLSPSFIHPENGDTLQVIARRLPRHGLIHRPDLSLWPQ